MLSAATSAGPPCSAEAGTPAEALPQASLPQCDDVLQVVSLSLEAPDLERFRSVSRACRAAAPAPPLTVRLNCADPVAHAARFAAAFPKSLAACPLTVVLPEAKAKGVSASVSGRNLGALVAAAAAAPAVAPAATPASGVRAVADACGGRVKRLVLLGAVSEGQSVTPDAALDVSCLEAFGPSLTTLVLRRVALQSLDVALASLPCAASLETLHIAGCVHVGLPPSLGAFSPLSALRRLSAPWYVGPGEDPWACSSCTCVQSSLEHPIA